MKVTYRPYRCTACGYEDVVQTNHLEDCLSYCKSCSWKGSSFAPGERVYIPVYGIDTIHRTFTYVGR